MPVTGSDLVEIGQGRVQDAALADATVARVWSAVESLCGWAPSPERVETLRVDGSGSPIVQIPTLRLLEVTAVREEGVEVDASAFMWSDDGSLRKRVGCWSREWRGIEVDCLHGFDTAADLDAVVLQVALRTVIAPAGQLRERAGQVDEQFGVTVSGFAFLEWELAVVELYALKDHG